MEASWQSNEVLYMATPLIQKHRTWRHLLRALLSQSALRGLNTYGAKDLQKALVIPVAVARWIAQFQPDLMDRPNLHLVIAGAEQGADSIAGGRWYQLIPALLGRPELKVKVSRVGPNALGSTSAAGAQPTVQNEMPWKGMPEFWAPAPAYPVTIGQFAKEGRLEGVDLVVLPHPGLEFNRDQWLAHDELAAVLVAGIPVALLSYAADEFEMERWAAVAYGYAVAPQAEENPFSVAPDEAVGLPVAIAHTLWRIEAGPAVGTPPDLKMQHTLSEYLAAADAWVTAGEGELLPEMGRLLDEGDNLVFIPPVLGASLDTGELYLLEKAGPVRAPVQLSADLIAARPTLADLPFARMAWALQVCQALVDTCGDTT